VSLITCPECRNQISSAAAACPHCGFPSPAQNKDVATKPASAPPLLPKEDVSDQYHLIPIDAKDSFEAAKQVAQHLNRFRAGGWTTGKAFAGADGINTYHIENATHKAALRFDMRPTLRRGVPSVLITMHTLLAAAPGFTETKINQLRKLNRLTTGTVNSSSGTFGLSNRVLLVVVLLALTVVMGFVFKTYGFAKLFHTIFNQ
jgi:hypothetical protein